MKAITKTNSMHAKTYFNCFHCNVNVIVNVNVNVNVSVMYCIEVFQILHEQ